MTLQATLTSKGQTTIPKEIRDALRLRPGDAITFTPLPDGTVILRAKRNNLKQLGGMLRRKGQRAIPIEQLSR